MSASINKNSFSFDGLLGKSKKKIYICKKENTCRLEKFCWLFTYIIKIKLQSLEKYKFNQLHMYTHCKPFCYNKFTYILR